MSEKVVLGILASGRGSNLHSIAKAVQSGQLAAKIGVVISDKPAANALNLAADFQLPAVCVDRKQYRTQLEFEQALANELQLHQVKLVVLAGFMRILSPYFVHLFANRIMNIHPSLLPAFPGKNAQEQAIRYGAKLSGCTVHFVDEGMDSGPVILQQAVPVFAEDTPDKLAERILQQEHQAYPQAIKLYAEGKLQIDGRLVKITE
ncbi:phosphoribosylglycinamide formyltransferase|uniref:Phosphoribosylglycinamide formyltransferase n=1 Tax=Dendrosporobacter quercicolus TaxID=146817 RepID=A0A1G9NYC1_9FIRM|nr:phosphoribosylglycinamide formyltransferase [Dendrosporobacter quercicolus]NSL47482.1 phosphoribosylglycinamide formyltransferase [Dendrosporobacter quercicolus DSM 1736]SDL91344.1 phosphoribosylglycinamide formyltransferase-1 [Dendrosporobacter quercicolus]